MKLVSLNAWGGTQGQLFFDYIREQSATTDIFCFQEVYCSANDIAEKNGLNLHLLEQLEKLLPDFVPYFEPTIRNFLYPSKTDFNVTEGLVIFVRKSFQVAGQGSAYIYGDENLEIDGPEQNAPAKVKQVTLKLEHGNLNVFNTHGLAFPGDKLDNPSRLAQSQKLVEFMNKFSGPKILCGDFNLMPDTESVRIIERANMENLIKKFNIKNTRNEASWKEWGETTNFEKQYFADYTFVSPDLKVNSFRVPYNEVSDHLPMELDFSII